MTQCKTDRRAPSLSSNSTDLCRACEAALMQCCRLHDTLAFFANMDMIQTMPLAEHIVPRVRASVHSPGQASVCDPGQSLLWSFSSPRVLAPQLPSAWVLTHCVQSQQHTFCRQDQDLSGYLCNNLDTWLDRSKRPSHSRVHAAISNRTDIQPQCMSEQCEISRSIDEMLTTISLR